MSHISIFSYLDTPWVSVCAVWCVLLLYLLYISISLRNIDLNWRINVKSFLESFLKKVLYLYNGKVRQLFIEIIIPEIDQIKKTLFFLISATKNLARYTYIIWNLSTQLSNPCMIFLKKDLFLNFVLNKTYTQTRLEDVFYYLLNKKSLLNFFHVFLLRIWII